MNWQGIQVWQIDKDVLKSHEKVFHLSLSASEQVLDGTCLIAKFDREVPKQPLGISVKPGMVLYPFCNCYNAEVLFLQLNSIHKQIH